MPWFEPSSSAPRYHHHRHGAAASSHYNDDDGDENEFDGGANNNNTRQNAPTSGNNEDFHERISLHNYLDLNCGLLTTVEIITMATDLLIIAVATAIILSDKM
jgi:hypothetical protein